MKNNELHQSEELARDFAPYRDEAPILSTTQIEKLLSERDMLPNYPSTHYSKSGSNKFNVRRIIMTLSGITGIAATAYFAFFSIGPQRTQTTYRTQGAQPQKEQTLSIVDSFQQHKIAIKQPATKNDNHGPWSAGNDQYYADLSREELARLGIVVKGDTVVMYNLNYKDSVEGTALTVHSFRDSHIAPVPLEVHVPRFYPVLTTFSNGHGAFYRIENGRQREWSMGSDDSSEEVAERPIREWLAKPGIPGLHALGFEKITCIVSECEGCPGVETDTVHIQIGKDLPQLKPQRWWASASIDKMPDSVKNALHQLANFYEGDNVSKPIIALPKSIRIKVDTVTAQNLIDEMDSHLNNKFRPYIHSIMARINELVPVIVHTNALSKDSSFILWYVPSDELFAAVPAKVAAEQRARVAQPPHCLSVPNDVLTSAEITYCVAEPQEVQVTVQDLTGKQLIMMSQLATSGDNVLQFTTETLPSGMYVVTVHDHDGATRSRRLWVENAHPKNYRGVKSQNSSPHAPNQMWFMNTDEPLPSSENGIPSEQTESLLIPSLVLDSAGLSGIGVISDKSLAAYYTQGSQPNAVNFMGVVRTWGAIIQTLSRDSVKNVNVPKFEPSLVTDGIGRKRMFSGDTNINELVPILLRASVTSDSIGALDLIFWYEPSSEFLADLSDSARLIAQQIINSNGNASVSVEAMHGAISKAVAYPNPSKGEFSVDLTLDAPRNLTFTLRNLLGQPVAPPVQAHREGESTQPLDFHSAGEGVYLLDITSDSGERFVQRIVIAR